MTKCIRYYQHSLFQGESDELAQSMTKTWFIRRNYKSIYGWTNTTWRKIGKLTTVKHHVNEYADREGNDRKDYVMVFEFDSGTAYIIKYDFNNSKVKNNLRLPE